MHMPLLTIREVVEDTSLENLRLVTGHLRQDNEIHNVNIIDNPDAFDWFTAGDFLLTTGFVFKDDVESQRRLIRELAEINCAGLGVKVKRYWDEIPPTMIEIANELNFPILEIPYIYSLAHVSNVINDILFQRESSRLKKYQRIHEAFRKCALSGGDIQEIARLSATIVNNPVIMVDDKFNLLTYWDLEGNPHPLHEYLTLRGREQPFDPEFIASIPTDVRYLTLSVKRQITRGDAVIICRIKPIVFSSTIYGYTLVWETMKKMEQLHYVALESAAHLAAMELFKLKQVEEARNRERQDFFQDLIEGKILSMNALRNLATTHGFDPDRSHMVFVLQMEEASSERLKLAMERIVQLSADHGYTVQVVVRNDHLLTFVPLKQSAGVNVLNKHIRQYFERLHLQLQQEVPNYYLGVSDICVDFMSIRKSIMLAYDVLNIIKKGQIRFGFFHDLVSYHLFDTEVDPLAMQTFFNETLGPLADYDRQYDSELLSTLEVYFDCNCNITQAAQRLYRHRNTLIYRLDKIKEILETNLSNPEENFNYQMAFKMYKLLQANQNRDANGSV